MAAFSQTEVCGRGNCFFTEPYPTKVVGGCIIQVSINLANDVHLTLVTP